MNLEKIIEKARELLPFTSDFENDKIRVILMKDLNIDLESQLDAPTCYDSAYHEVEFRKQYVNGIIIGWEFVGLIYD